MVNTANTQQGGVQTDMYMHENSKGWPRRRWPTLIVGLQGRGRIKTIEEEGGGELAGCGCGCRWASVCGCDQEGGGGAGETGYFK